MRRLIALALAVFLLPSCALKSTVVLNPAEAQIQATREKAITIAWATENTLQLVQSVLTFADAQQKAGTFSTALLRDLAQASKGLATGADVALVELGRVTTNPSLLTTASSILRLVDPFIIKLETSDKETLRVFGISLRVAVSVIQGFVTGGDTQITCDGCLPDSFPRSLNQGGLAWAR